MKTEHKIKFYPVGNADNTLIKLSDNTTIIIDCQIREGETDTNGIKIFDVKKDLLKELEKDTNKNHFVDVFVLSHPHNDHCLGFEKNFYSGKPEDYGDSNRKNEEIIIGELWVTQQIFINDLCSDALAIRKEVKRRKKLFEENHKDAHKSGNRLRFIGYNENDTTVDGLHYVPGETVNQFNGVTSDYLSFFIHAPFKDHLVVGKAERDHNTTSIIFQAQFRTEKNGEVKSKVLFSGDSDHYVWEKVKTITEGNNNEDKLEWDIFLTPHHCSWTFFNDTPYKDNKEPKDYALDMLDYKNDNADVVASSVEILDNDANPPCYQAKEEYEKKVGKSHFRNTAINVDKKAPEPIVYIIDDNGFTLLKAAQAATSTILTSSTPRAGRIC